MIFCFTIILHIQNTLKEKQETECKRTLGKKNRMIYEACIKHRHFLSHLKYFFSRHIAHWREHKFQQSKHALKKEKKIKRMLHVWKYFSLSEAIMFCFCNVRFKSWIQFFYFDKIKSKKKWTMCLSNILLKLIPFFRIFKNKRKFFLILNFTFKNIFKEI